MQLKLTSATIVFELSGLRKSKSLDDTRPTSFPVGVPSSVIGTPENPNLFFTFRSTLKVNVAIKSQIG